MVDESRNSRTKAILGLNLSDENKAERTTSGASLKKTEVGRMGNVGHSFGLNEFVLSLYLVGDHGRRLAAIFIVAKAFLTVVEIGVVGWGGVSVFDLWQATFSLSDEGSACSCTIRAMFCVGKTGSGTFFIE